ncbi:hypothetical protein pb186bvf_013151 [Paramecium bursaria]
MILNQNLQQSTELGLAPSLVKYGNPVLVSTGQKKLMKSSTTSNTEDILNSILPPREFVHSKQQVQIQCVSAAPSTKQDVLELQEKLDKRLQQRQARETGLCPIREELYSQCFDELIRQITINCAERGLLLVRVRDEVKMVIQTYQTLYASSCAFGMRKFLQEMERKEEMKSKIKQLENECDDLQTQVNSLQNTIRDIKSSDEQRREQNKQNHAELVAQIKLETKNKVTQDLEQYLTGKKKMVEKKQ